MALVSASPVADRGVFSCWSLHERSPVGGSKIHHQLQGYLGIMDDGINKHLMIPYSDAASLLNNLLVFWDVRGAFEQFEYF